MFKKNFYTVLLVIAGLLLVEISFSQSSPNSDYNVALPGGINLPVTSDADIVCPSLLPGNPSPNIFTVSAVFTDVGDINANTFEWVVYGGWITHINGVAIIPGNYTYSRLRTSIVQGEIRYSYITENGVANPVDPPASWVARITVEWDTTNFSTVNGWAAVRQTSEWGCSDGNWSVFTNTIRNDPPQFVAPLTDIHLPNSYSISSYTLPLPDVTDDDACNISYPLYRSVVVENPVGNIIFTGNELVGDYIANLQVGTNRVTWTVFDGSRSTSFSYNIIVEPALNILNVAWINPICGNNDGSALVTGITNYAFTGSMEYSFDGEPWDAANSHAGLAPGNHDLKARLVYSVDFNFDGSDETLFQETDEVYTYTLHANSPNSVSGLPAEGPDAVVIDASCLNKLDGEIAINGSVMIPQNNSVSFNGSGSYLLLNKSYNGEISAFSVAAWIRTPENSGTIISFDNSEYYHLGLSLGRVQLTTRSTNDEDNIITVDNEKYLVNDNRWHLVVVAYGASMYSIYVDGVLAKTQAANGSATIGKTGVTRYGMIGALAKTATFNPNPQGNYFNGQMAEVAVWDGITLNMGDAVSIFTGGMGGGMNDHWVLNDVPANVSPAFTSVFTDAGNSSTNSNWGRFYNNSLSVLNSPKLYSWTDEPTNGTIYRKNLAVTSYTLNVKDIFGCGTMTGDYEVENGDANEPYLLWNAAVAKPASQSSTPNPNNPAGLASDGLYSTTSLTGLDNQAWWDVNLNNSFPIHKVRIHSVNDITNVWVMISPAAFSGATLANDLDDFGIQSVLIPAIAAGGTAEVSFSINSRHVRIRTADILSLQLSEVEVLTSYKPSTRRKLYITDQCNYQFMGDDVTIDPVVYDDCGGTSTLTNDYNAGTTLVGEEWPINSYTVNWTATDENMLQTTLAMTYDVVDEEPPIFESDPFAGVPTNFTYCAAQTYQFPVPSVTDNYHHCSPMRSISLYRDGVWLAYSYPDMGTYDYLNPGFVPIIPAHMKPGDHTYEWRAVDSEGNSVTRSLNVHIQEQPLLFEVKVAPISCNGANDAAVYFTRIQSEPSATVDYILRPVTPPGTDISQITSTFSPVAPGTYKALISVNGCESNVYHEDVVITNPDPIVLNPTVTNVKCFGELNGAINLNPTGGSQTYVLHLFGDAQVSAANYAALNLTTNGMIECWVFLDSLANGGMNWNADLFGAGNSYGLRMVNGALNFYAGSESVTANIGDITQRVWTHIAGAFTWNGIAGNLTLYINGNPTTIPLVADPAVPAGGGIHMGYNGAGYLNGFVRSARIWNTFPAEFGQNTRLINPIDPGSNLVANFPVNESGGSVVINTVIGGSGGSVSGTNNRRRFAYYWLDNSGNFLSFSRDIDTQPIGVYNVTLYDPLGCSSVNENVTIQIDDNKPPTMAFFSDHDRLTTPLGDGVPIIRYTNAVDAGSGNIAGDCLYFPYGDEFDPRVSDGDCSSWSVTYALAAGSDAWGLPAPVGGEQSLDGIGMTGIIVLDWTATDPNGLAATKTITYWVVDNESPVSLILADATRSTNTGRCDFTVPAGDLIPVLTDNCGTGRLYNNLNNDDNLDGWVFDPGVYNITWTYEDRLFPGQTPTTPKTLDFTLTVEDNQLPTVTCKGPFDVYLDDIGVATIDYLNLDAGSTDNCGNIADYYLSKNLAIGLTPTATNASTVCNGADIGDAPKAVDGNTDPVFTNCSSYLSNPATDPFLRISFGTSRTVYGIQIFATDVGTPLNNFRVQVSKNAAFNPPINVTYDYTYLGAAVTDNIFLPTPAGTVGTFVRITLIGTGVQLGLAEIEVFAAESASSELLLECPNDVRYTPDVNPLVQGTFGSIPVMLSVVDDGGNTSSCLTDVRVIDQIQPTTIAKDLDIELGASGTYTISAKDDVNDGSTDNCGEISYFINDLPTLTVNCNLVGTNLYPTFTALDKYGNRKDVQFTVSINDNMGPILIGPAAVTLNLNSRGEYTLNKDLILQYLIPGSVDNCGGVNGINTVTASQEFFNCTDISKSPIDITVTAKDFNNNTSTRHVNVTIADNTPPVARAKNIEIRLTTAQQTITYDMINNGSYDNCAIDLTRTLINGKLSTDPGGWPKTPICTGTTETVTLQVFDVVGNASAIVNSVITYKPLVDILSFGVNCDNPQVWIAELQTAGNPLSYDYYWQCFGEVADQSSTIIISTTKGIKFFDESLPVGKNKGETDISTIRSPYLYDDGNGVRWYRFLLRVTVPGCATNYVEKYQNINFHPGNGQPRNTIIYPVANVCKGEILPYDTDVTGSGVLYSWAITNGTPATSSSQVVNVTWNDALNVGTGLARCLVDKASCLVAYEYPVDIKTSPVPVISPTTTTVCPGEIVTYNVTGMVAADTWTWTKPTNGTIIDGGNPNQNFMQIEWASVQMANAGSVSVVANNGICTKNVSVGPFAIDDTRRPQFTSTAANVTLYNIANNCSNYLTSLSVPTAVDYCASPTVPCSYCDVIYAYTIHDQAGIIPDRIGDNFNFINQELPVGVYTVTWTVKDNVGNYNDPATPYTYTITILDNRAPKFDKSLQDVQLVANETCEKVYSITDPNRNGTATDNCTDVVDIIYSMTTDYRDDGSFEDTYPNQNSPVGISFKKGVTRVRVRATDKATPANFIETSYLVTVQDQTLPVITNTINFPASFNVNNKNNVCFATAADIGLIPPGADELSDNCTSDLNLVVQFVRRTDRALTYNADFEVGTPVVITWRVTDESGNYSTTTQTVTVTDNQKPWFDAFSTADVSISYCASNGYRLPIPAPNDNCGLSNVKSITYTVMKGVTQIDQVTILRKNGVFNPYGNGLTLPIANFFANVDAYDVTHQTGTDFSVIWTAEDENGNIIVLDAAVPTNNLYSYKLHVEIEPIFSSITNPTPMTCGVANASIVINTTPTNTPGYHYDRNYSPEFSIDNGSHWGTPGQTNFSGLLGGDYTVKMRVNGCVSVSVFTTTITQPIPYTLTSSKVDVLCPEDNDGSITLTMGGGAPGQLHFAGTGFVADDYNEIDLTTQGSIGAWVYFDDVNNDGTLLTKGPDAYRLNFTNKELVLTVGNLSMTSSGFNPVSKYWYYIVATWSSGTGHIYANGIELIKTGSVAVSAIVNTTSFTMGSFNGILRDVCIWNSAIGGNKPGIPPYTGQEAGLMGYWQLNNGVGAGVTAKNSCITKGIGKDAIGSVSLWNDALPQPGTYTWKRNGSFKSNLINLSGLDTAIYVVSFVDTYGCPDIIPLTSTQTIVATDDVAPVISDIGVLTVNADPFVCNYLIDDVDEVNALTPTIIDASGCNFDVTWKRVVEYNQDLFTNTGNNSLDNKIFGTWLGRSRLNGLNTITVTTLQNGDVTSTKTYTITVTDNEIPVPDGKFDEPISMDLDPLGQVAYPAINFNRNSQDNCSDPDEMTYELSSNAGVTWGPSINFDCNAIGTPVTIWFRVTDEAGNRAVQTGDFNGLEVRDVTAPVFIKNSEVLLPYCANKDAAGSVPAYKDDLSLNDLKLIAEDYFDNCGVTRIRYKLEHSTYNPTGYTDWHIVPSTEFPPGVFTFNFNPATFLTFYEGTTTVTFELWDGRDIMDDADRNKTSKAIFTINVLPKPNPGGGSGIE